MSDETLTKDENIIYQLETLSTYEPVDLDYPEFDVLYENKDGSEGFATVCCVDLAASTLELINRLKAACESSITALEYMEHESKGHKSPFDPNKLVCYKLLKQLNSQ